MKIKIMLIQNLHILSFFIESIKKKTLFLGAFKDLNPLIGTLFFLVFFLFYNLKAQQNLNPSSPNSLCQSASQNLNDAQKDYRENKKELNREKEDQIEKLDEKIDSETEKFNSFQEESSEKEKELKSEIGDLDIQFQKTSKDIQEKINQENTSSKDEMDNLLLSISKMQDQISNLSIELNLKKVNHNKNLRELDQTCYTSSFQETEQMRLSQKKASRIKKTTQYFNSNKNLSVLTQAGFDRILNQKRNNCLSSSTHAQSKKNLVELYEVSLNETRAKGVSLNSELDHLNKKLANFKSQSTDKKQQLFQEFQIAQNEYKQKRELALQNYQRVSLNKMTKMNQLNASIQKLKTQRTTLESQKAFDGQSSYIEDQALELLEAAHSLFDSCRCNCPSVINAGACTQAIQKNQNLKTKKCGILSFNHHQDTLKKTLPPTIKRPLTTKGSSKAK